MRDNRETKMMGVRWKVFEFYHTIPEHEQKNIIPCPTCFAEFFFFFLETLTDVIINICF